MLERRLAVVLGAGALAMALGVAGASVAEACGMFRSRRVAPEKMPSLSREKVLLIHDAERGQEHFIREVAFERAGEPLGFVVPTPTRPTVAAVGGTPFTKLREWFPFMLQVGLIGSGSGSGYGRGSGAGLGKGGVTVLEQTKVGSFETFVLAATDEADLAKWLADNGLVASEGAKEWLEHYVRMGFYYVAMRYDPPRVRGKERLGKAFPIKAETIRISFETPVPYYPYLEPVEPKRVDESPRLLEVWYAGHEPVVPVALKTSEGEAQWVRPLKPGDVYPEEARKKIENALHEDMHALLPAGALVVQTFQDQKRSRAGFGDVLFVPENAEVLEPKTIEALEPLLGVLDPALVPAREEVAP